MKAEKIEEYVITDELLEEIRNQFKLWALFLNTGFGLLAFTLAIACLGTSIPWINGIFSMIVVFLFRFQGGHYFPKKIQELRDKAKEDDKAKVLLNRLNSEFLGLKVIIKHYPIGLIGYFFLCFVIVSPYLVTIFPSLSSYIGN